MGDADDRFGQAVNDPEWNFRVAADEALAARVLKDTDPELANRSLATAKDDWRFAVEGLKNAPPTPEVYGAKDELERVSFGAIASADLFRATGEKQYADEAIALGNLILQSQERKLQPWTIPLTGYFYTSPKRENLFHRFHIGEEEQPIVALAQLCEAFPDDPDWIHWYAAIVLHSKYYQQACRNLRCPLRRSTRRHLSRQRGTPDSARREMESPSGSGPRLLSRPAAPGHISWVGTTISQISCLV